MKPLKLVALDEEDLRIVSAHVQDAVVRVSDINLFPAERRFVAAMNRFAWESGGGIFSRGRQRRRSVLHFEGVTAVKATGIDRSRPDEVLSLLALRFAPGEPPAGTIELTFSGGAALRLDVDYVEARLADLGAAWKAGARPRHAV